MTVTVRMVHIRRAHACARGARAFFVRHKLDWPAFLRNGIDAEVIRATGDPLALQVAELAEKEARDGQ